MKSLLNTIHRVADSLYKIITPSDEEAARMVERYKAIYGFHLDKNYK
jgi:hypothetical protein